jgi:hypothetical protein
MERKVPWWLPRARAMRGAWITAALLIAGADAFAYARNSSLPPLAAVFPGILAGFLLCIASWPRR